MEGDEQVLKRKRNGETVAPRADGDGRPALLVAERVRKVYRTGEIQVEALVDLDLTVGEGDDARFRGAVGVHRPVTIEMVSGEIQEHAYWGGMRDRIPLSQTSEMAPSIKKKRCRH